MNLWDVVVNRNQFMILSLSSWDYLTQKMVGKNSNDKNENAVYKLYGGLIKGKKTFSMIDLELEQSHKKECKNRSQSCSTLKISISLTL